MQPLEDDLAHFKQALKGQNIVDGFMNAAHPALLPCFSLTNITKIMKISYRTGGCHAGRV